MFCLVLMHIDTINKQMYNVVIITLLKAKA